MIDEMYADPTIINADIRNEMLEKYQIDQLELCKFLEKETLIKKRRFHRLID